MRSSVICASEPGVGSLCPRTRHSCGMRPGEAGPTPVLGCDTVCSLSSNIAASPQPRELPRIQDLRHSFAVNALLRWYRAGADVEAKLPLLATYLGHGSVVSTHHYLHFIEPLRTAASKRFAAHYGELVSPLPQPARRRG